MRLFTKLALLEGDEFEAVLPVPVLLSNTVVGSVAPEEMNTPLSALSTGITDSSVLCLI